MSTKSGWLTSDAGNSQASSVGQNVNYYPGEFEAAEILQVGIRAYFPYPIESRRRCQSVVRKKPRQFVWREVSVKVSIPVSAVQWPINAGEMWTQPLLIIIQRQRISVKAAP